MKNLQGEIELNLVEKKDLKQQLKDIKSEKDLYERLLHWVPEGILVADEKDQILFSNKQIQNFFSPDNWEGLIGDKNFPPFFQEILDSTRSLDFLSFHREIELLTPELQYLSITCIPFERREASSLRIFFIKDVTRQIQSDSKEISPDFVDNLTFSAGIAHELGNPIAALSLHAQLLNRLLSKARPGKEDRLQIRNSVDTLNRELSRLDSTLHEFLDAVRPTNPRFTLESLQSVIEDVLLTLDARAKAGHVQFRFKKIEDDEPLFMDAGRIKQALTNVLLNAVEISRENSFVDISLREKKDFCEIQITDYGKGIPASEITRIFDPFYTTKETGNGLGLLVTYRVIKDHGGNISVKSKPGEGTTFFISIPLRRKAIQKLPSRT